MRVLFAGGGTGGHIFPAVAIAEEFKKKIPDVEIMFVGTAHGAEMRIVPKRGFEIKKIWISGFYRKITLNNLLFPLKILVSLIQSFFIIKNFKPDIVIGTGGYVSGPIVYIATLLKIPTLIQEQNSYPGVTTRLLASKVNEVHLSFEDSIKYFSRKNNLKLSGNPVRCDLNKLDKKSARKILELEEEKTTLLVFGGSQGAHSINEAILKIIDEIIFSGVQVIWQTGNVDFDLVKEKCKAFSKAVLVKPFFDEMPVVYSASDLAVCRSGALTLAEISVCGLPAILVPYPFATANHQEYNARAFANIGAVELVFDKELRTEKFFKILMELLSNSVKRNSMREKIFSLARVDSKEKIVESAIKLISR